MILKGGGLERENPNFRREGDHIIGDSVHVSYFCVGHLPAVFIVLSDFLNPPFYLFIL